MALMPFLGKLHLLLPFHKAVFLFIAMFVIAVRAAYAFDKMFGRLIGIA